MNGDFFAYTDLGNAKRWADLFVERFKWIPEQNAWYRWNGSRWEKDIDGSHVRTVDTILSKIENEYALLLGQYKEAMQKQASNADDIKYCIKENRKWYAMTQTARGIEAMIKLARSQPDVSKSYSEFDSKGKYLGVKNGVINLKTREFITDQPKYFITKSCNADYQPDAKCPHWMEFLNRIFDGDQEKVSFIQRLIGQGLLGTPDKSMLTIFHGIGANGKSTLVDTIVHLMGDYASNTTAAAITNSRANKEYYLAALIGVRLSIINETKKGAYLEEEFVKSLVDSGAVQARPIYGRPISFQPVATPILVTNYQPRITADYSINRRLLYVPFEYQLPPENRNPRFIVDVLYPELSGILNWALEGCFQYQQQQLNPPASVLDATRGYINENDRIARFIEELYTDSPDGRVALQEVKQAYVRWATDNGYREVSVDRVAQDFRARGYRVEKKTNGYYYVLGIKKFEIADAMAENVVKLNQKNKTDKTGLISY